MKIKNKCDPRCDVNKTLNLVGTYSISNSKQLLTLIRNAMQS